MIICLFAEFDRKGEIRAQNQPIYRALADHLFFAIPNCLPEHIVNEKKNGSRHTPHHRIITHDNL